MNLKIDTFNAVSINLTSINSLLLYSCFFLKDGFCKSNFRAQIFKDFTQLI